MPNSFDTPPGMLRPVLRRLARLGIVPAAANALSRSSPDAGKALRDAVLAEVPAFSASGNPHVIPSLNDHGREHFAEICRLFSGGDAGDFAFIRAHAHRRAEQRFPLEATLHAYRCGHRVFSQWLREAAIATNPRDVEQAISAVADFAIEYTNAVSTIVTAEYVAHTRLLAETQSDLRTELLNVLLTGYDEADGHVTQLLKRAGYLEQRQSYCIVVAQAANPSEMRNDARAKRIEQAITQAAATSSIRTLAGIRNNLVTVIFADRRRQSGWTAPRTALVERLTPLLETLGPAVLIGMSAEHPSTSYLPKAFLQATTAIEFASVGQRVVGFSQLPIRSLLIHRGADYARSTPPAWVTALLDTDRKLTASWFGTLRAVADTGLNVQKAGRLLGVHPNTVYARLARIKARTGLDGQCHHDLVELLLAADCWQLGGPK